MFHKPIKRVLALLLTVVITANIIALFPVDVKAVPSGVPWDVFIDEDNNICIVTQDKIKSSSIWYNTVGFSVSRCRHPAQKYIHETKEYAWFAIDKSKVVTQQIGNIEINIFKLPLTEVRDKIAKTYSAWASEIEDALNGGAPCYLRFDSTMVIYRNGVPSGTVMPDGTPYLETYTNEAPNDGQNPDAIKAAENWADPHGLDSHYNRYLLIGGGEAEAKEEGITDTLVCTDGNNPIYEIANWSDQFDLSQGIPSSEDIHNRYRASSWYGSTDVYARLCSKKYSVTYTYKWEVSTTVSGQTTTEKKSKTHTFNIDAKVAFQYLANANFYDFTTLTAQNFSYPMNIDYDSEYDVPMKAITTQKYYDVTDRKNGMEKNVKWLANTAKHVTWAASPKNAEISVADEAAANNRIASDEADLKKTISNGTKTKNDLLQIDGITYLSNKEITGCDFFNSGSWKSCKNSSAVKLSYKANSLKNAERNMEEDSISVTIPAETENGKYPSGINCFFAQKIKNNGCGQTFRAGICGGEDIKSHIISGYAQNEPVNVHTPVISPVVIWDEEDDPVDEPPTQLTPKKKNKDVKTQLILDNDYTIKWNADIHRDIMGYGDSGDPSKYDKYVTKKEVKFPFEVEYNGTFYAKGKWITLQAPDYWDDPGKDEAGNYINHWRLTPFYIPSYATECGEKGNEAKIEYRVHAINVDGRFEDSHEGETEYEYNITYTDNGAAYVATYALPVQLSGIIYDFTITGTSDKKQFFGTDLFEHTATTDVHIPFCKYKWDKKVGTKNRLGEKEIRNRSDSSLNDKWETVNTLPIMLGKSNHWAGMGNLIKGTKISFSFKTIANLYNEDTDYVKITPSFRYVKPDGTVLDSNEIKVYYTDRDGDLFVEYGKEGENENLRSVYLGNPEFERSYYLFNDQERIYEGESPYQYGDWVNWSVKHYNNTKHLSGDDELVYEEYLKRETPSYNLSHILLTSDLRFLSGEYEQLKRNSDKQYQTLTTYRDVDEKFSEVDRFRNSMQTWYGQYLIPSELFVVDLTKQGKDFDLYEYVCDKDRIRMDDEVFEQKGYLIINFQIETYLDGKPHLQYYGYGKDGINMWKKEGFQYKGVIDPDLPEITFEDGDVAVVDLSQSMSDRYQPSLFNIN